jgi:hypothetical protein
MTRPLRQRSCLDHNPVAFKTRAPTSSWHPRLKDDNPTIEVTAPATRQRTRLEHCALTPKTTAWPQDGRTSSSTAVLGSERWRRLEHDRPFSNPTPSSQRQRLQARDNLPTSNARPSPQRRWPRAQNDGAILSTTGPSLARRLCLKDDNPGLETTSPPQTQGPRLKSNNPVSRHWCCLKHNDAVSRIMTSTSKRRTCLEATPSILGRSANTGPIKSTPLRRVDGPALKVLTAP